MEPINKELQEYMLSYLTENRLAVFDKVLDYRTRHMKVVLENIYQPQNASAVVRTCDIYGVQDLHAIENGNEFDLNPQVVMGSSKWVDVHHHNSEEDNTRKALLELKSQGYKIVATSPHAKGHTIHDLPIDQKFALCFGTELTGLSDTALELADDFVTIPMFGFTESFNISVSAAICMSHLATRLHNSDIDWQLTNEEREQLLLEWSVKTVVRGDAIRDDFLKKQSQR